MRALVPNETRKLSKMQSNCCCCCCYCCCFAVLHVCLRDVAGGDLLTWMVTNAMRVLLRGSDEEQRSSEDSNPLLDMSRLICAQAVKFARGRLAVKTVDVVCLAMAVCVYPRRG